MINAAITTFGATINPTKNVKLSREIEVSEKSNPFLKNGSILHFEKSNLCLSVRMWKKVYILFCLFVKHNKKRKKTSNDWWIIHVSINIL